MLDETRRMWDILKGKVKTVEGLLDLKRYFPELSEEIDEIIVMWENEPTSD